jgi:hypothetical protein
MWKSLLILAAGFGATAGTLWTAVDTLRKVLHIKDSGIDPAAAAPAPGSPFHPEMIRQARRIRAGIVAAIAAILALLALP